MPASSRSRFPVSRITSSSVIGSPFTDTTTESMRVPAMGVGTEMRSEAAGAGSEADAQRANVRQSSIFPCVMVSRSPGVAVGGEFGERITIA